MTDSIRRNPQVGKWPLRKRALAIAGALVILTGVWSGVVFLGVKSEPASDTLRPDFQAGSPTPSAAGAGSVTARVSRDHYTPWPAKPQVVGPPAGFPRPAAARAKVEVAPTTGSSVDSLVEPPPPSRDELAKESTRDGDEFSPEDAKAILLDETRGSAIKLVLIDKLRTQDPGAVIPILVAYLEAPGSSAGAYTKPTAVKVLTDLRDPRADEALGKLASTSSDERVRVAIAALRAKEKSR